MSGSKMRLSGMVNSPLRKQPKKRQDMVANNTGASYRSFAKAHILSRISKVMGDFLTGGADKTEAPLMADDILKVLSIGL